MIRITIEPNDVLLFRDLKPFTAGEAHIARSTLPLPQTIAGALRTKILIENDFSEEAKEVVGYENRQWKASRRVYSRCKFTIVGTFLSRRDRKTKKDIELFPLPFDISTDQSGDYFYVKPHKLNAWGKTIFKGKSIHFKKAEGFLEYSNIKKYLKGELKEEDLKSCIIKNIDVFSTESRIGIKLSDTKTTSEGMFFKSEFLRLKEGVKIVCWLEGCSVENGEVDFNGITIPARGYLKVGGESRFVKYKAENINLSLKDVYEKIKYSKKVKLYIATPVLNKLENGKFSSNIANKLQNIIKTGNLYHVTAKPLKVSGWDYANNSPRGLRYAIPAGSVYFAETKDSSMIHTGFIKIGESTELGYGLVLMGLW